MLGLLLAAALAVAGPASDQDPPVVKITPIAQTDDTTPTFTGSAGILPGDLPEIVLSAVDADLIIPYGRVPVAADGTWSYTPETPLGTGRRYTVTASQADDAGNTGHDSMTVAVGHPRPFARIDLVAKDQTAGRRLKLSCTVSSENPAPGIPGPDVLTPCARVVARAGDRRLGGVEPTRAGGVTIRLRHKVRHRRTVRLRATGASPSYPDVTVVPAVATITVRPRQAD
jgi:hypothetical protein